MRIPTFRDGLRSLLDGLASIATWGETDARRARHLAGLDDPRPGHVKDAEKIRGDWEMVLGAYDADLEDRDRR
jgi:hypothetical protein